MEIHGERSHVAELVVLASCLKVSFMNTEMKNCKLEVSCIIMSDIYLYIYTYPSILICLYTTRTVSDRHISGMFGRMKQLKA